MKKLSETYKEQGIAFTFPIKIKDANGNDTYYETSRGYWCKREYDANGNKTYFENISNWRCKWEYDSDGNETYYEDSDDYWWKRKYDSDGNETYFEDSDGRKNGILCSQSYAGKVIEVDGKRYKLMEL